MRKLLTSSALRLFRLSFLSFSYLFTAVINLPLGLLPCSWNSYMSQPPVSRSLWSAYQCDWKHLFLLQNLNIDYANFGQKWWRQNWNKSSSRPFTADTGINRLISEDHWEKFFFKSLKTVCKETKLRKLQFKFIHRTVGRTIQIWD